MRARFTCCLAVASALAAGLEGCALPEARGPQDWLWGRVRRGLQSRIVFEKCAYKQGEPILCWVEVRNASDKPVPYDARVGAEIEIVGPDGEGPPDISWKFYSTMEEVKFVELGKRTPRPRYRYPVLKPGEVLRLGPNRFDDRYYMGAPGVYRFHWPGAEPLPEDWRSPDEEAMEWLARGDSEAEEKEAPRRQRAAPREVRALPPAAEASIVVLLAPGGLPHGDAIGRLLRVMPPYWEIERPGIVDRLVELPGHKPGQGSIIGLFHAPAGMVNHVYVTVWVLANAADWSQGAPESRAEYLGKGKAGHVYIERRRGDFGDPEARWLHMAYDIAVALGIEPLPPKPDGPDWGRLVCRILRECREQSRNRQALGYMCQYSRITCTKVGEVRMELVRNLARPTPAAARGRKEPDAPYYDVLLVVRPRQGGEPPSAWDNVAEWRTPAGTRGEVCWRIASDDAPFRKALGAIFDRQVKLFLKANMRSDGPPSR